MERQAYNWTLSVNSTIYNGAILQSDGFALNGLLKFGLPETTGKTIQQQALELARIIQCNEFEPICYIKLNSALSKGSVADNLVLIKEGLKMNGGLVMSRNIASTYLKGENMKEKGYHLLDLSDQFTSYAGYSRYDLKFAASPPAIICSGEYLQGMTLSVKNTPT